VSHPEPDRDPTPLDLFGPGRDPEAQRRAIADFVLEHQTTIRAIARKKLTQAARGVFDSEEVLSSVLRRLDAMAQRGGLLPRSHGELWALVTTITHNTAVSKTRLIEFMRSRLTEDGPYAYELVRRLNACADDDEATLLVYRMMSCLPDATDRQILSLKHRGATHAAAASLLGTTEDAMRHRWMRIRRELCARFTDGTLDA
jgi:DNA-directed RNA polymerase specialized sigma24 family protein